MAIYVSIMILGLGEAWGNICILGPFTGLLGVRGFSPMSGACAVLSRSSVNWADRNDISGRLPYPA
jgi:hypothetical protein